MKFGDFVKEHKKLIKILTTGSRAEQKKEAKSQTAELLRAIKKNKK